MYAKPHFPLNIKGAADLDVKPAQWVECWLQTAEVGQYIEVSSLGIIVRLKNIEPYDDFRDYERDWAGFQYGE